MMAVILAACAMLAAMSSQATADEEQRAWELVADHPKTRQYVEGALGGDPKDMKTLGIMFEVLQHDFEQSAYWYRLAALSGNARAQLLLANSFQHGRGVPESKSLAFAWYMTASAECDPGSLSAEAGNGPYPSDDEMAIAREMSHLIRMLIARVADMPDCTEYFDQVSE